MADDGRSEPPGVALTPRTLLGVLRLGSAALPIGAFAYSQALETATSHGHVTDAASATRWIGGLADQTLLSCDVPIVFRMHAAWQAHDDAALRLWNDRLYASRGSRELRAEERQLGTSLMRLLAGLGNERALPWAKDARATLGAAFALSAVEQRMPAAAAALGYAFAWAESQVGAATRLVPLGQTSAQGVLAATLEVVAREFPRAASLADEDIAATAPGQALLSSLHEAEYSRLFRS